MPDGKSYVKQDAGLNVVQSEKGGHLGGSVEDGDISRSLRNTA